MWQPLTNRDWNTLTNISYHRQIGVGLFYGGVMLLFGLLSLLITTTAVAIASSVGGSYATFYGKLRHFLW